MAVQWCLIYYQGFLLLQGEESIPQRPATGVVWLLLSADRNYGNMEETVAMGDIRMIDGHPALKYKPRQEAVGGAIRKVVRAHTHTKQISPVSIAP